MLLFITEQDHRRRKSENGPNGLATDACRRAAAGFSVARHGALAGVYPKTAKDTKVLAWLRGLALDTCSNNCYTRRQVVRTSLYACNNKFGLCVVC